MDLPHKTIELADDTTDTALQLGYFLLPFQDVHIGLSEVFLVPNLEYYLVSVGRVADKGIQSRFVIERLASHMNMDLNSGMVFSIIALGYTTFPSLKTIYIHVGRSMPAKMIQVLSCIADWHI